MANLSPEFRRILAVLLLLSVPVLGYGLVVEPLLAAHREADTDRAEARGRLIRFQNDADTLPAIRAAEARIRSVAETAPAHIDAPSETLAATQLLDVLNRVAPQQGAQVVGTRVLGTVEEGAFQKVGLRVTMTSTLRALQGLLYELEAGRPILFVEELTIQTGATSGKSADPELSVAFNLLAYRQGQ